MTVGGGAALERAPAKSLARFRFRVFRRTFVDAAHFVQQSTVWDAGQSADFVTAAVITYCPQFESTASDQMQHTYQKSLTNLQTIEGDLQGINNNLQDIRDGLHGGS